MVYHCFGGAHSSPVAAAIHAGLLPADRVPDGRALARIPYFDTTPPSHWGELLPVGKDAHGHEVYVMGHGPHGALACRAVLAGYALGREEWPPLLLIDTVPYINLWMRIGGFLSRRLRLVSLGRPLVIWGARRAYPRLAALVREVQARCDSRARPLAER
ncbi:DUF3189 family protein [Carboxydochorda subterranea]|uniref:DUF3189 family protein n=1 Tax=Carboxydichorda subterranea TaxID=3109565 RepID=A0ABZ1C1E7_9FIRM|nr:DUF3189 family protein [Limnochorda sp. L945t]WRP18926.1 DUF3189 family protein [Limnochorda sp. L945t]